MASMSRRYFLVNTFAGTLAVSRLDLLEGRSFPVGKDKYRVAVIGCGRLGQHYAEVYKALPDAQLVAIAEWNPERRRIVGERFGVKALYQDAPAMLKEIVPDIAAVVTPTKFMKEAVIACAEAGVKGVSTDKPIAARLSDADQMVEACKKRGVVFAGGNLQRAMWEVQQAARRLEAGEFGKLAGAAVHSYGGEISGGCCQHISVLRLWTGAEVDEVMAWGNPLEALKQENDGQIYINGRFHLTSGLECQVFGTTTPYRGVDVWTDQALVRWDWAPPKIFRGTDSSGSRIEIDPKYPVFPWKQFMQKANIRPDDDYLVASIRSLIDAVKTGSELWISGYDLRQALEVAIASKLSAQLGNLPVKLPLKDRSLTLFPTPARWVGYDATGQPQSAGEAAGKKQ